MYKEKNILTMVIVAMIAISMAFALLASVMKIKEDTRAEANAVAEVSVGTVTEKYISHGIGTTKFVLRVEIEYMYEGELKTRTSPVYVPEQMYLEATIGDVFDITKKEIVPTTN